MKITKVCPTSGQFIVMWEYQSRLYCENWRFHENELQMFDTGNNEWQLNDSEYGDLDLTYVIKDSEHTPCQPVEVVVMPPAGQFVAMWEWGGMPWSDTFRWIDDKLFVSDIDGEFRESICISDWAGPFGSAKFYVVAS